MHVIRVEPFGEAWRVRAQHLANDMLFHSGREAEMAARRLGERLSQHGTATELQILLRDGSMAGRFISPAAGDAG